MPITTQSAVVPAKDAPFEIRELELREPRPHEVVVDVAAVGVCHTDIIMQQQFFPVTFPAVFGHEGSGVVRRVGDDVTKVAVGDHVVMGFASCGGCRNCLRGLPSYCQAYYEWNFAGRLPDGTTSLSDGDGEVAAHFFGQSSFSRQALCSERNVVRVDPTVDLSILGPLGCGVQTGAGAVLNSLDVEAGATIAVFGAGGVGLSAVMAAVVAGATTIIAIDVAPQRLDLATRMGATHVIDASRSDVMQQLSALVPEGLQYTLETTGRPEVLVQAVDSLMVTGVCGTVGASPMGTTAPITMNNLIFGRTIRGICEGDSVPEIFIPQLIELHRQGRFPFDAMLTSYAFEDINKACEDATSLKVVKPVLVF
ncbi:NAD(P)-dependent alcohol dehydrogenase [Pseudonocardia alni]|uniref:NAD(P)-dependent alcohol dehydrogenase n=1 Tax=Pseudonocardia alni TaxID=33907 RepID=UPI003333713D